VFQLYYRQHRKSVLILDILKQHKGWGQQNSQLILNHQLINYIQ
jgi:hypothetical protein